MLGTPRGWFGGTFDVITQDWELISKRQTYLHMRNQQLYTPIATHASADAVRDREVVHPFVYVSIAPAP